MGPERNIPESGEVPPIASTHSKRTQNSSFALYGCLTLMLVGMALVTLALAHSSTKGAVYRMPLEFGIGYGCLMWALRIAPPPTRPIAAGLLGVATVLLLLQIALLAVLFR